MKSLHILMAITITLIAICFLSVIREGFQSAGTLLQLETSHVPTRAEILDRQHWLRQRVRQDLWDLTGS